MCKSAGMHSNCTLQHFQLHTIHDYMVYIYIHNIYIYVYIVFFFGFVFWLLIWSCQRLLAPLPPGRLPALGFSGYHFANGKLDANQPFHFFFFLGGVVTLRGTWQVWMHAASVPGSHAVVRAVEEWQEWESPDSPCLAMLRLKIRQNMSNEFFPTHARAFAGQASRAYSFHLISWHVWFIMGFIIVDPRADQRLD